MGKSSKQRSEANLMYRPSGVTWLLSVTIEASEMYDVGVDALHPRTTYLVKARVVISRDLLSTVVQYCTLYCRSLRSLHKRELAFSVEQGPDLRVETLCLWTHA